MMNDDAPMSPAEIECETGMNYLTKIPANDSEIPDDHVLVHNHVRPAKRQGTRGFRFWTQEPSDQLVTCDCDWAPEIQLHYRIVRGESA